MLTRVLIFGKTIFVKGNQAPRIPMNTETKTSSDMHVHLTTEETFTIGRAAQVQGVTSITEFARENMLAAARKALASAKPQEEAKS